MKNSLFAPLAAILLTATSSFALPLATRADDHDGPRFAQGPGDRDFNYGYAKNHRVTDRERAAWEAQHRNDRRADVRRADDHFDRNQNYGFDRDHKVTRDERRHWEEAHNYGYAQNHRVTPQERSRWEASYRR